MIRIADISPEFDHIDYDFAIAVSGGGDSMALLYLIADWAAETGAVPHVLTVNHNLRVEAAAEAAFVAETCARLGLIHATLSWDGWDGQGNIQAMARAARYDLMAGYCRDNGLAAVMLGHTMDDVAETFLMRLARGAGVAGLSAMRSHFRHNGTDFIRPLLGVTRADLRDYLRTKGATWVEDPSNDDPQFDRVRVRKILPALADIGIDAAGLAQTAGHMRDAQDVVARDVQNLARHAEIDACGQITMDRARALGWPVETRRQFWTKAVQWVSGTGYAPRATALSDAITRADSEGRAQINGCELFHTDTTLRLCRELAAVADVETPTDAIWDNRWQLSGPHHADLCIRALGPVGILHCDNWRETGIARNVLMTTPAIWQGETLIAAPMAGFGNDWSARIVSDFYSSVLTH